MPIGPSSRLRSSSTGYLKSRQGCKTCKIRRVKCGEEKPHCTRCTTTGRKCEYEGTISMIDNPLSSSNTVWRERRSFAYYFQQAAPYVGGWLDVTFWSTIVPQVCRSEPAVWDAIIVIGALFESPELCTDFVSIRRGHSRSLNQNHQDVLGWYSRSVSTIRQQIERGRLNIFVGLISCLLFICIESLQGGVKEASQLYSQGVRLILAFRAQIAVEIVPSANASLLETVIVPIFLRLGSIALPLSTLQVGSLLGEIKNTSTQEFDSLKSAREGIVLIAAETQVFQVECVEYLREPNTSNNLQKLTRQQSALSARLKTWHSAFLSLEGSLRTREVLPPQWIGIGALLFAFYEALFITLRICLSSTQTDTDAYIPNFQNIVKQSEIALDATARPDGTQPPYTVELNIGLPLWFTCFRCREPRIRRTALALLRQAPRVLGFYQTRSVFNFGEQIMALEERYGMTINAGQARASSAVLKSPHPPSEHQPDSHGTGSRVSKFDLSTLVTAPKVEDTASVHSMPAGFENSTSTSMLIPEEARMGPIKIFRPQNGLPEGTTEKDIAKWKPSRDQLFLRFTWNVYDPNTDSWRRVHEYVPTTL